jgi:hypothetical protein
MSVPPLEVLRRPVRAAGSSRLATAVVLAVLALGLPLVRVDAMPRTPGSAAVPVASSAGLGPAAAAVTALVTTSADQDPLAAVPADFAPVMGYTPVPMRIADGTRRLAKPTGACSVPGGGAPFGFHQACQVHDYGYDLLRYAHATGQYQTAEARRQLDAMFARDLHAHCQVTRRGLAGAGCHLMADLFTAGVSFNSWRQHHGNPAKERVPGWAAVGLRGLLDATPAGRDRYVDFLRVMSIATVVLGHWTLTAVGRSSDGLAAGNVLSAARWLWLATWCSRSWRCSSVRP